MMKEPSLWILESLILSFSKQLLNTYYDYDIVLDMG